MPMSIPRTEGPQAVSSVLIKEEEGLQKPIYYLSKVLHGAKQRYPEVEKLAFALITTASLQPYFISHPICVRTNAPLRATLEKPETSGRMVKWAIELSEYDISYQPRSAIKAQALAEFVQEATFIEGSKASNNEAKYEALIARIKMDLDAGAEDLITYTDSQLVTKQVQGEYEVKERRMKEYLQEITELTGRLKSFQLHQLPRTKNTKVDYLARLASSMVNCNSQHHRKDAYKNSPEHNIMTVQVETDWRRPLLDYLEKDILPPDEKEASHLRHRATREECIDILQEIHEGACGSHVARWALANKALRAGYFWPTLKRDATSWAKGCKQCQQYAQLIHVPAKPLRAMSSPCPFS
ncbi:UNVERIFIED_CONTAM: Ribonuclease HI [Sesamum latifolium]|uniref:Ribonuclease HI n=1 Tax=Sesamum latifolium TaxID=2727402 RepID=A0AAW2TAU9_9LAMI